MKRKFWIAGLLILLIGCEKNIEFDLDDTPPKLVVEATIENEKPPVVILTRSTAFFSTITAEALTQSFIHDANVFVSNGTK